eukprot:gnl/MRDRNA2_/MRDRNA2_71612_c0_seq1.p1 gnl/MRDRNA2_/MRDRNA2_71612_c0~~gnl/MRDRNA2_/MRDRNA2_71612_c0_seq1.p1  ORF type:complete len:805 (-),score=173.21 gnl/MRDRNA2_/MRDRNA2_71612_c0_seq1:191-2554(-)
MYHPNRYPTFLLEEFLCEFLTKNTNVEKEMSAGVDRGDRHNVPNVSGQSPLLNPARWTEMGVNEQSWQQGKADSAPLPCAPSVGTAVRLERMHLQGSNDFCEQLNGAVGLVSSVEEFSESMKVWMPVTNEEIYVWRRCAVALDLLEELTHWAGNLDSDKIDVLSQAPQRIIERIRELPLTAEIIRVSQIHLSLDKFLKAREAEGGDMNGRVLLQFWQKMLEDHVAKAAAAPSQMKQDGPRKKLSREGLKKMGAGTLKKIITSLGLCLSETSVEKEHIIHMIATSALVDIVPEGQEDPVDSSGQSMPQLPDPNPANGGAQVAESLRQSTIAAPIEPAGFHAKGAEVANVSSGHVTKSTVAELAETNFEEAQAVELPPAKSQKTMGAHLAAAAAAALFAAADDCSDSESDVDNEEFQDGGAKLASPETMITTNQPVAITQQSEAGTGKPTVSAEATGEKIQAVGSVLQADPTAESAPEVRAVAKPAGEQPVLNMAPCVASGEEVELTKKRNLIEMESMPGGNQKFSQNDVKRFKGDAQDLPQKSDKTDEKRLADLEEESEDEHWLYQTSRHTVEVSEAKILFKHKHCIRNFIRGPHLHEELDLGNRYLNIAKTMGCVLLGISRESSNFWAPDSNDLLRNNDKLRYGKICRETGECLFDESAFGACFDIQGDVTSTKIFCEEWPAGGPGLPHRFCGCILGSQHHAEEGQGFLSLRHDYSINVVGVVRMKGSERKIYQFPASNFALHAGDRLLLWESESGKEQQENLMKLQRLRTESKQMKGKARPAEQNT